MITWYVTTGVSLWEQSRCWVLEGIDDQLLERADLKSAAELQNSEDTQPLVAGWARTRQRMKQQLQGSSSDLEAKAAQLVAENFRTECWSPGRLRTLSAELTTLYLLLHRADEHRIAVVDNIVCLVGDSNREVGYVLKAILARVGCPNRTTVVECGNLDPIDDDAFNRAMQGLAETMHRAAGDLRLVLTGGYKGVLIALARSFPYAAVYYTHERSPNVLICFRGLTAEKIEPPID